MNITFNPNVFKMNIFFQLDYMEIIACPRCGSRQIYQGNISDGVLTGYTTRFVCKRCHYQGMPLMFSNEKDYNLFLKDHRKEKHYQTEQLDTKQTIEEKDLKVRPPGITILTALLLIQAFIIIFFLIFDLIPEHFSDAPFLIYFTLLIILQMILPIGIYKGKPWAYTFSGILFVLMIPIGLIYLYYFTRPQVRAFFRDK